MKKNKKVSSSKKPFLVLSRRGIAGWIVVIFFVSAWMFVIGVLVGRGTAPVKFDIAGLRSKLLASKEVIKNQKQGPSQEESRTLKDKTKLDFYEVLKENRKDTKTGERKASRITGKKPETLPGKKPSVKTKEGTTKKSTPPKSTTTNSAKSKQVASKSKTKPSGKVYTIQVASLKAVRDADRLSAELKKKGFRAYRVIGKVPGKGIYYRVRIGTYKNRVEARRTLEKLKKAGMKPIVVEK